MNQAIVVEAQRFKSSETNQKLLIDSEPRVNVLELDAIDVLEAAREKFDNSPVTSFFQGEICGVNVYALVGDEGLLKSGSTIWSHGLSEVIDMNSKPHPQIAGGVAIYKDDGESLRPFKCEELKQIIEKLYDFYQNHVTNPQLLK